MSIFGRALAATAFTALLAVACAGPQRSAADDQSEMLETRQAQFAAALEARDVQGMVGLFAADAVLHVADMAPIEGRDAIGDFYDRVFGFLTRSSVIPHDTRISEAGDMAYSVGTTRNGFSGPEGVVDYDGKYLLVWRRIDDDWVIAVYSISSNEADEDR